MKGSTRLPGTVLRSHTVGKQSEKTGRDEGKGDTGLAVVSVSGLQHRFTQCKVPVVFGPMLFEMFTSHVLCWALFKLHLSKAPVFGCTLGEQQKFCLLI